jgi:hypothetical protein
MAGTGYIADQRRKWEGVKRSTAMQYGLPVGDAQLGGPAGGGPAGGMIFQFGLGQDDLPPITAADMQRARPKVEALYGNFGLTESSSMKEFAKKVREDADLVQKTWPVTEHCMTVGALERLIIPLKELVERVAQTGFDMATTGIRRLIGDRFREAARRLLDEVSEKGIGAVLSGLRQGLEAEKNTGVPRDEINICLVPKGRRSLRNSVILTLQRVAITLEAYADLEDFRPSFAKNRVFDFMFDVFFKIGEVIVAIADVSGRVINSLADLAKFAAESAGDIMEAIKIATIAGGAFAVWWYFLRDGKKKKVKS